MEKVKKYGKYFLPLLLSVVAILFLLGVVLTYETKVKIDGVKYYSYFDVHLWDMFNAELAPIWPGIIIVILIALGGLLPICCLVLKKEELQEKVVISSVFCTLLAFCFVVAYKEIFNYFAAESIENFNGSEVGWGSAMCMLFLALSSVISIVLSPKKFGENVQAITEDGLLIAMAFVLNFIKLPIATGAGSVNLQMFPLFLIALRRGPLHGFIAGGIVYGMLTCITDGYGLFTFPFDYLIGFGSVAIIGLFRKLILAGENKYTVKGELVLCGACVVATLIRFIGSSVSSMVFYSLTFVDAMVYNSIYIPVSGAIATALIMLLLGPVKLLNTRYPVK